MMAREIMPVPLDNNDLVDLSRLQTYIHPNPDHIPLTSTPGWKYHHVYHPRTVYTQKNINPLDKDQKLIDFRGYQYNQLMMRVSAERIYHEAHQTTEIPPEPHVIEGVLRDFRRFDALGAVCVGVMLARGDRGAYHIDPETFHHLGIKDIPRKDRQDFFLGAREEAVEELEEIEFTPQRLVTSAIKRLAKRLGDEPFLSRLAEERLAKDPVYFPIKTPSRQALQIRSIGFLNEAFAFEQAA